MGKRREQRRGVDGGRTRGGDQHRGHRGHRGLQKLTSGVEDGIVEGVVGFEGEFLAEELVFVELVEDGLADEAAEAEFDGFAVELLDGEVESRALDGGGLDFSVLLAGVLVAG
jgi:hypothetical protein